MILYGGFCIHMPSGIVYMVFIPFTIPTNCISSCSIVANWSFVICSPTVIPAACSKASCAALNSKRSISLFMIVISRARSLWLIVPFNREDLYIITCYSRNQHQISCSSGIYRIIENEYSF